MISAKEAKNNADLKLNSQSILDAIFYNISVRSKLGGYNFNIRKIDRIPDKFTPYMLESLFTKSKDEVILKLENLGYKIESTKDAINIFWNEID